MDGRILSRKFVVEFLDLYRSQECLWKANSKDYRDKFKRQEAYNILAEKLRQIDPDASRDTITRKIDSFRSCFRKELRKVKISQNSTGPVYKPRLWYYDHMTFLIDQDDNQNPAQDQPEGQLDDNSLDSASLSSASAEGTPFGAVYDPIPEPSPATTNAVQTNVQGAQDSSQTPLTIRQVIYNKKPAEQDHRDPNGKNKARKKTQRSRVGTSKSTDAEEEDEFDVMGKNIGNKLRRLPEEKVMIVEKLITDLIFEAQTGNVTQSTRFNLFDLRNASVSF